jgi:hypothetical protein
MLYRLTIGEDGGSRWIWLEASTIVSVMQYVARRRDCESVVAIERITGAVRAPVRCNGCSTGFISRVDFTKALRHTIACPQCGKRMVSGIEPRQIEKPA